TSDHWLPDAGTSSKKRAANRGPFRFQRCCSGSAAVTVRVARHGALDVVPAILHGALGFVPLQPRVVAGAGPVALQVRLDVLETLAAVLAVGVVTVLVRRL